MYGGKIITDYGVENGESQDVVGEIKAAPAGNLALTLGRLDRDDLRRANPDAPETWEMTGQVTLKPSEALAFAAAVVETYLEHEGNKEKLEPTRWYPLDVRRVVDKLKGMAGEVAAEEADAR